MKKLFFSFWIFFIITKVHSQCAGTGSINFQRWNNISGGAISDLTSNINYPNNPASTGVQTSFEMPINQANNFGIKMYGYICPPASGTYVFWIAADNSGELWLSTSANSTEKVRIAYNTSGVSSREWNRYTTQKSVAIALIAGQKYYVEALMKESNGKDNLAVGWAKPGQNISAPSEVIPGSSLFVSNNADTQAPSPPANLTASNITTTSFTLSWSASSDNVAVTGYDVYKEGVKINTAIITTTSFDVTGLSSNSTYSMTVKAKDAAGNESASNALPITTNDIPDTEAPSAPTNLIATNITASSFTLNWNASTDNVAVTGYDVYKDEVKINASPISSASFEVTGLSPNTMYSMTVKAKDAAGNESASNALPITTNDIPDTEAPSAPTNLIATNITASSITLSWSASTDNIAVTGYDVYKDGVKINTSIITTTSFGVTGLSPNTTYSMTVKAKDAAGNESTSNILPVTTNDIPDTEAPSGPTNLSATNVTPNSFILSWSVSTDNIAVTGYDIYENGVKINSALVTSASFNVTGLSPGTTYSMTVVAKDAAGNQSSSNPFAVTTQASTPPSPILTLPLSTTRTISNQTNVVIENFRFENINGIALNIFSCNTVTIRNCFFNKATAEAINIENSSNIIIEYCLFNGVTTAIYALKTQNIKVRSNQFVNVRMRDSGGRGQFVQFNEVTGAGNIIENNRGENFAGESNPEDLISIFISSGTPSSPIYVRNNIFRGGGPSTSGSGIMAGDHGGGNTIVENNILLDPGQSGIAVAGGKNISILNNKIYARQQPFTNNPLYVWGQTDGSCSNITVRGNRINWTDKNGMLNNGWNAGNCNNTIFEPSTTITLAEINVPDHLIDMVTPSELLLIRGVQFVTRAGRHK